MSDNFLTGYSSVKSSRDDSVGVSTAQPVGPFRRGLDGVAHVSVYQVSTHTVGSGSTTTTVVSAGHQARVGDLVYFSSGALSDIYVSVVSVTSNSIGLAHALDSAPSPSDSFIVYRYRPLVTSSSGGLTISSPLVVDTELPSATLISDGESNPTTPRIGSMVMGLSTNGSNVWDRLRLAKLFDLDSSSGTENVLGVSLRKAASGGSIDFGTASDPIRVDPTGTTTQPVVETRASSATLNNIAASTSSVTLQASNSSRRMWTCFNDSSSPLYIKFGTSASSTSFTVKVFGQGYFELPFPCYSGVITGVWDSATGNARVTEIT